jgi:hypothetical protein
MRFVQGGKKEGLHGNAAPFKIQYPMKNRIRKYRLFCSIKAGFDELTELVDEMMAALMARHHRIKY